MTETIIEKLTTPAVNAPEGPRRLCKDCRYCRRDLIGFLPPYTSERTYEFAKCLRPLGDGSPVTGNPKLCDLYCSTERGPYECIGSCGRLGRYWTPK